MTSTSPSISQPQTQARTHSAADQITNNSVNSVNSVYQHDLKGNLTEYEINAKEYQVEYDLDNRITKVDVDNNDVEYRYDAFGRRVIRKQGTTTTSLIWWGNSEKYRRLVGILDKSVTNCPEGVSSREAAANQCAEHKHQAGQTVIQNDIFEHPSRLNSVIARAIDGSKFKLQWYHKNYLDHVYGVSDDSGDILEHYRYTAFGEVTIYDQNGNLQNTTQIDNHILWNTRRRDEVTGYYMYKFRHYSAELGRWPSRDPIKESGGVNLYAFVGNNGINYRDRLGLLPIPDPVSYINFQSALDGASNLVGDLTKKSRINGINQFKTWYDHTNANITAEFIYNDIHDSIFEGVFASDFQVYKKSVHVDGVLDSISPASEGIEMLFGVEYSVQIFSCACHEGDPDKRYLALNNLTRGEFPNQGKYANGTLGMVDNPLAAWPPRHCKDGKLVALVHSHNIGTGSYLSNETKKNNIALGIGFMFFHHPTLTNNTSGGDQSAANIFEVPNYWVDELEGGSYVTGHASPAPQ